SPERKGMANEQSWRIREPTSPPGGLGGLRRGAVSRAGRVAPRGLPQRRPSGARHGPRLLSPQPPPPDLRLRAPKETAVPAPGAPPDDRAGGPGLPRHAADDSDPDISLSQREHLLQTAETIRADGHEDWFVLTGLIHGLGKVLCLFGELQWAAVGDTFPVGCAFSERIIYPELFAASPGLPRSEIAIPVRRLPRRLRAAELPPRLGPRRVPLPRRQE